ncbi:MAG: hypothetical protein JSU70_00550 [Phycisphaerales bacterium]|nr:MAG: hypothetical protein JSU70_00550 [Phycisphaerales bacterium]
MSPFLLFRLPIVFTLSAMALFAVVLGLVLVVKLIRKTKGWWLVAIIAFAVGLVGSYGGMLARHRIGGLRPSIAAPAKGSELEQPEQADPAIWQPGIEDHLQADIYPSKATAMRSLGLRMAAPVREVCGAGHTPQRIIVFRGNHDRDLLAEFRQAVSSCFPGVECVIERESVAVDVNEVGIRLDLCDLVTVAAPWSRGPDDQLAAGTLQAGVLGPEKEATAKVKFAEKPWVEDFDGFLNAQPDACLVLARSEGSCTTEAEANREAIESGCVKLTQLLAEAAPGQMPGLFAGRVTAAEIIDEGLIVDRFVQSFGGRVARVWRQALLIDASRRKLAQLSSRKAAAMRAAKRMWACVSISAIGLLGLIAAVCVLLNAATRGYYVWSLRIAGTAIALIGIVSIVIFLGH